MAQSTGTEVKRLSTSNDTKISSSSMTTSLMRSIKSIEFLTLKRLVIRGLIISDINFEILYEGELTKDTIGRRETFT